jgi:hypothetical protein
MTNKLHAAALEGCRRRSREPGPTVALPHGRTGPAPTKLVGSRRKARTHRVAGMAASHPAVDTSRQVRARFSHNSTAFFLLDSFSTPRPSAARASTENRADGCHVA